MIFFDEKNKVFYLENEKMSYVFGINPIGIPEHIYFGEKTGRDLFCGEYSPEGRAHYAYMNGADGQSYNTSLIPAEIHTPYSGDYQEPSLVVEFPNGNRRLDLKYTGYEILKDKPCPVGLPHIRKGETLKIVLSAKNADVELYYTLVGEISAVVRRMRVINNTDGIIKLNTAYSFSLDLPESDYEAVYIHGGSGWEANLNRTPLARGIFTMDSKRGISSSTLNPFAAFVKKETTENIGIAYGVNLIYSGSYAIKADVTPSEITRITGGINDFDFSWTLQSGEMFDTPEAVLVFSNEGLSGMSRQFHDLYREALIPDGFVKKSRPIVINNWEATRFAFTVEKIKSIVDRVAGTGIDTFVLDDGWFGKREDATSGLGDWFVNEKKMQGSMKSFIEYVHSKGMKFGLWFEPEMVNVDSDLYRAHPDWAMQTPDEVPLEGRTQLMLDLTRKEVRDYIVKAVNDILDNHDIDYVKWDCNRDLSEGYSLSLPKDRQKETYHRQILGLYDIFERIVNTHPKMIFEGCASGGSRFDAGVLFWFPQIWTSDQTDVASRCRIQYGTSMCYPLSAQSCHVTESPNRRAKHITPLKSRCDISHLGANGYELDTTKMTDDEIALIPSQVKEYRDNEDLVLEGDLYRIDNPFTSDYFGECLVSKDKRKARITVMKYEEVYNKPTKKVYAKGLQPDLIYKIEELGIEMTGRSIMNFGIRPRYPQGDFITFVYHLKA